MPYHVNRAYILPTCILLLGSATMLLGVIYQQLCWQMTIKRNHRLQQQIIYELQQDGKFLLAGKQTEFSVSSYMQNKHMLCDAGINCLHRIESYILQHVKHPNYQVYIAIGQQLSGFRSIFAWHLMYHYK